jgi:hypothetical protein
MGLHSIGTSYCCIILEKWYKHKYLTSKDPVEARRWGLSWKVAVGWTIKNSAIGLEINYQYAKNIVKKYNELGAE